MRPTDGINRAADQRFVLVVDDDPGMQGQIADALEGDGYVVRLASSASEALELSAEVEPALMIVDVDLTRAADSEMVALLDHEATLSFPIVVHSIGASARLRGSSSTSDELPALLRLVRNLVTGPNPGRRPSHPVQTGTGLDPTEQEARRGREALIRHLRWVARLEPRDVVTPFLHGNPRHLDAFRRLLALRESAPDATQQMAAILASADDDIGDRLASVPPSAHELPLRSLQQVIALRSYRRIHSAALGAGAAIMWDVPAVLTARHWRHGNATGVLSQLICADDPELRDRAYAAGLLHDLGRLAVTQFDPGPWGTHDRERWSGRVVYYADALGRRVADGLELPLWVRESLLPCGLPPRHPDRLSAVVHASCAIAYSLGMSGLAANADTAIGESVRDEVRAALAEAGGLEWLEARIRGPLLAARAGLRAAIAAA